jgi:phage tail sheath protein FI
MTGKNRFALAAAIGVAAAAAAAAYASNPPFMLGTATHTEQTTYQAYYDGHKDVYLITDVSSKAQAKVLNVNYSAAIGTVKGAPAQYFVKGHAAAGQLSVFGSEPGESDYNPLWEEFFVTWKSGAKPVLLVRDDQIKALAKKGKLTLKDAHIVLNAPIIKVGKGSS